MKHNSYILIAILVLCALTENKAYAHAGHAQAPGTQDEIPSQNIELTETAIHNLGIQTEKAQIADIAKTISLNALVDVLPERYAQINSKVPSRITEVFVQSGQRVAAGSRLATIQPLAVGSTLIALTSPIDGVVLRQSALQGQTVLPENSIFEIADLKEVLVRGQSYETASLPLLKAGETVSVISSAYSNATFTGKIERLDASLDRTTRTLDVYARVANPENLLLKNMQVTMQVAISDKFSGLVVPRRSILGDGGNRFLFVKEGNGFERRDVKLGIIDGNNQEILEGVFPDEEIVVTGQYQLQFASPAKPNSAKPHKE